MDFRHPTKYQNTTPNWATAVLALVSSMISASAYYVFRIPIEVSFLPLLGALLLHNRVAKLAFISAYVVPIVAIGGIGLIELGVSPIFAALSCGLAFIVSTIIGTYLGVAALGGLCLIIGFFPAGPLSLAGALFPNQGLLSILTTLVLLILVEKGHTRWFQGTVIILSATLSLGSHLFNDFVSPKNGRDHFATISLSHPNRKDAIPALLEIDTLLQTFDTLILGENTIQASDNRAIDFLCGSVRRHSANLYVGVERANGAGDMVLLSPQTCTAGEIVYQPINVAPGLNGSWGDIDPTPHRLYPLPNHDVLIYWIACFEGVTLRRWLQTDPFHSAHNAVAVIYSNTGWAKIAPAPTILTKFSQLHARLMGIDAYEAKSGQTALGVLRRDP